MDDETILIIEDQPTMLRGPADNGVGLAVVKFIVDAHGGSVDVESEPGKGAVFTVKLPVSQANTS